MAAKQNNKVQHQLHNGYEAVGLCTGLPTLQVSRLFSSCACLARNVGMPGILLGGERSIKLLKIRDRIKYIIQVSTDRSIIDLSCSEVRNEDWHLPSVRRGGQGCRVEDGFRWFKFIDVYCVFNWAQVLSFDFWILGLLASMF